MHDQDDAARGRALGAPAANRLAAQGMEGISGAAG
jgi:hypothetical protein